MRPNLLLFALMALTPAGVGAVDYPYQSAEPQKTGWPLAEKGREYVLKPEHERRPGHEANKHLPHLWPVVPSAGSWAGTAWLDTHAKLVEYVKANPGPCDVLLVGDSITQQWGSPLDAGALNDAWKKHFAGYKTLNIGVGGDKSQNVLWRLDHGGADGIQPKVVVLMVGNNNMFFTAETGIEPAAKGVQMCVANLREKFPKADVVVVKILPCHAPGVKFYDDIKLTNAALDPLKLDADPKVTVLDLWGDFTGAGGKIMKELFTPDNIHLSPAGYAVYADRLEPLLTKRIGKNALGGAVVVPKAPRPGAPAAPGAVPAPPAEPGRPATPKTPDGRSLVYPYAPYNAGKLDPQLTGWPLTAEERAWVAKGEYARKPGHEVKRHLPEMWPVTPAAARWGGADEDNAWLVHHAACVEKAGGLKDRIDVALVGDSITQGWGGGWDGAPFNAAWQKHFGTLKTVNLGIGGDRTENVLWRLDHGALGGATPGVIVLMVGVNNAPLVEANGVPAAAVADGIRLCVDNLRLRCPDSRVVVVKVLPAFDPRKGVGRRVRDINSAVDELKLGADAGVVVLDLWDGFANADGTLKAELYSDKHLHLGPAGYEVFAARLKDALSAAPRKDPAREGGPESNRGTP
ncbi:hydrolase gdsl : Lipolytic protein G-D-S-L family OS=Pedosphaera parvula (strain Ellin514) GN=Cflav_PD2866 PE=4 SV=1: Lipase_GDSL_2: Lipase_GDSL_2 [Gemmataceae bacterium]|nr:hydrolase gdsl : Lipolytic protein G-D-S-L family OS=Pedosphaera parvula (strain Ellin514) GN=Cflav_PD2866 PE=4 SV=1: Lipase_GDSL_2: Lipase_GDSL_2 [Gemmataceae bacterium]VTU02551.1 hydrolase gdsl : Lipolytic protein G-D-S-L family OS=Pedosphaera parvula (strain Ellin514) GN=Cflav_PD2866 PE=4 SV=1: Lipase_GDSL_2: Lipase_GDSL_2 [Gemmataceae bacterium]